MPLLSPTEVDGRCQEIIRSEVALAFPDHYFLGEEDVPPGAAEAAAAIDAGLRKADWVWIGASVYYYYLASMHSRSPN
jgi:fructose-1,6-bisphosphatase/inositol monophosphatase family enzyme